MSGFPGHSEGREYEVECNRCGHTRLLFLPDGFELTPCRAPHPHSTQAAPAECGGTSFDVNPAGAAPSDGETPLPSTHNFVAGYRRHDEERAPHASTAMPYPEHATYERLYARYFRGERTQQMLKLAGPLQGRVVADLCGGGGRLSLAARDLGAKVTLVDESSAMLQTPPPGITVMFRDILSWLSSYCGRNEFDGMFCQQAVNYWLTAELALEIAEVIKPGGFFIFNTFNRKPGTVPAIKQYELDGVNFAEASWMSGDDVVEHVQMREGEPPHTTRFNWISPEQYRDWLGIRFHVTEHRDGASSVWVCLREN